ncbi:MAG: alanine racemase [Kiritimatiellia bacterium]|jgi:alanine racemase
MKRCRVEVQLSVLARNIHALQEVLNPATEIIFVVKSNAYGHGLSAVVVEAAAQGVRWFAVAYLHEALEVRKHVSDVGILVLGAIDAEDVAVALRERITPVVMSFRQGQMLAAAARASGIVLPVHVKIDTGMGRLGLCGADLALQLETLVNEPGLRVDGICSHFATVEQRHPELARTQYERFMEAVTIAEAACGRRLMRHLSSSRAIQFHEEWDLDAIRPGILLYGYGSSELGMRIRTRPWLTWKAYLMQVKTVPAGVPVGYYSSYRTTRSTDIATMSVGYADGFLRSLSNNGFVLVKGIRRPVVGRISMNWVTLDLGPDSGILEGEEVVIIGRQGDDELWADEIATWAGTIAYETLTAISQDIPRGYIQG